MSKQTMMDKLGLVAADFRPADKNADIEAALCELADLVAALCEEEEADG